MRQAAVEYGAEMRAMVRHDALLRDMPRYVMVRFLELEDYPLQVLTVECQRKF